MSKNGIDNKIRYGPDMKILIIGGGVAGLTLAGLLQRRGFCPKVVERAPAFGKVGYVIVIWPSGSRVLKGLGVYEKLLEEGSVWPACGNAQSFPELSLTLIQPQ